MDAHDDTMEIFFVNRRIAVERCVGPSICRDKTITTSCNMSKRAEQPRIGRWERKGSRAPSNEIIWDRTKKHPHFLRVLIATDAK